MNEENQSESSSLSIPYGGDTEAETSAARPKIEEEIDTIHNSKPHLRNYVGQGTRTALGSLFRSALVTPIIYKVLVKPEGTILEPPSYTADIQANVRRNGNVTVTTDAFSGLFGNQSRAEGQNNLTQTNTGNILGQAETETLTPLPAWTIPSELQGEGSIGYIDYSSNLGDGTLSIVITNSDDSEPLSTDSGTFIPDSNEREEQGSNQPIIPTAGGLYDGVTFDDGTLTFNVTFNEQDNFRNTYSSEIPVKAEVPQNTTIPLGPLFGIGLVGTVLISEWERESEKRRKKEKNEDTLRVLTDRTTEEIQDFEASEHEPTMKRKALSKATEFVENASLLTGVIKVVTTHGTGFTSGTTDQYVTKGINEKSNVHIPNGPDLEIGTTIGPIKTTRGLGAGAYAGLVAVVPAFRRYKKQQRKAFVDDVKHMGKEHIKTHEHVLDNLENDGSEDRSDIETNTTPREGYTGSLIQQYIAEKAATAGGALALAKILEGRKFTTDTDLTMTTTASFPEGQEIILDTPATLRFEASESELRAPVTTTITREVDAPLNISTPEATIALPVTQWESDQVLEPNKDFDTTVVASIPPNSTLGIQIKEPTITSISTTVSPDKPPEISVGVNAQTHLTPEGDSGVGLKVATKRAGYLGTEFPQLASTVTTALTTAIGLVGVAGLVHANQQLEKKKDQNSNRTLGEKYTDEELAPFLEPENEESSLSAIRSRFSPQNIARGMLYATGTTLDKAGTALIGVNTVNGAEISSSTEFDPLVYQERISTEFSSQGKTNSVIGKINAAVKGQAGIELSAFRVSLDSLYTNKATGLVGAALLSAGAGPEILRRRDDIIRQEKELTQRKATHRKQALDKINQDRPNDPHDATPVVLPENETPSSAETIREEPREETKEEEKSELEMVGINAGNGNVPLPQFIAKNPPHSIPPAQDPKTPEPNSDDELSVEEQAKRIISSETQQNIHSDQEDEIRSTSSNEDTSLTDGNLPPSEEEIRIAGINAAKELASNIVIVDDNDTIPEQQSVEITAAEFKETLERNHSSVSDDTTNQQPSQVQNNVNKKQQGKSYQSL